MKHALLSFIFVLCCGALSAQSSLRFGQAEDLRIYPNPVAEYFQLGHSDRVQTISLMNMAGRVVKRFIYEEGGQYPISELHRGLYLVQLRDKQNHIVRTLRMNKQR